MIPNDLHRSVDPGELGKTLRAQLEAGDKEAMALTVLVATAIRVLEVESVRVVHTKDGRRGSHVEDPSDIEGASLVPEGVSGCDRCEIT
jgi:flagellar biosynthesis/type III secretory pathway M-ring protein FliF/YscJ